MRKLISLPDPGVNPMMDSMGLVGCHANAELAKTTAATAVINFIFVL
jgi:hypothetical protein